MEDNRDQRQAADNARLPRDESDGGLKIRRNCGQTGHVPHVTEIFVEGHASQRDSGTC